MHKLRNLDLNLLVIFQVIYEEESLGKAGKRVGLSQSAISHSLSRLRDYFSDPLFIRSHSGMSPTSYSKQLYNHVLEALNLLEENLCQKKDNFIPCQSRRQFSLAMGEYGEFLLLPGLIELLQQKAPGVSLNLSPGYGIDATHAMKKGDMDLAFDWLPFDGGRQFQTRPLIQETIVAIARSGHPQLNNSLTPELFAGIPHVIYRPRFTNGNPMDNALKTLGMVRKIATVVNQLTMIPGIIARTDYLGIMPFNFARQLQKHYPIKILTLPFEPFRGSIYMIWHNSMEKNPGHCWFRNLLIKVAEDFSSQK